MEAGETSVLSPRNTYLPQQSLKTLPLGRKDEVEFLALDLRGGAVSMYNCIWNLKFKRLSITYKKDFKDLGFLNVISHFISGLEQVTRHFMTEQKVQQADLIRNAFPRTSSLFGQGHRVQPYRSPAMNQ